ncbi:plastid division protein CDP1, chloroplastic isoform X2 [Magnolia sinica]|uniref:plastid division protein CDP1, chloroplastic isoform X2 n=1 Tax=Magnolia sinica TaxID=86752 RepID=UPI00265B0F97|nr:plastid division protein CDP1, chloroplastic isoform X2 [Magnolia sinica]
MALSHLMLSCSACCYRIGIPEEQKNSAASIRFVVGNPLADVGTGNARALGGLLPIGLRRKQRVVIGRGRLKVTESQTVESGQIRTGVEIPVTCHQIVGVPNHAEKDEIVKSVMDLKGTEIEEGYTLDVVVSRQDVLMDVRDKLLFEPEYAGNAREKIPPKSPLRIPWAWLPGALCLLQEVGEERLVLEIGRAALQHPDSKPYTHDLVLSMALAECSIAKTGFEKNKVSQGFEALARAQYLLRTKSSLGKMPLLAQIEESLEELAPACTLELLNMPNTPENSERRRGAMAALRELLRQGLEVETSCRVQDWPCFLSQSLNKLMATEIVDLLHWDELAVTRKNKKSLESQNQRVVIDFNCFYMAVIAHIGHGFSSRQTDLINKAKTICECLVASEGIDLKFEEALCSLLLGQGGEAEAAERLRQLETNGTRASRSFETTVSDKVVKDSASIRQSLEIWLKDTVLGVFPDTRDCSPSLANFFGGEKRIINGGKQKKGTTPTIPGMSNRSLSFVFSPDPRTSEEPLLHMNSTRHLGSAVKQLAPANLQSQLTVGKSSGGNTAPPIQLKRNLGTHQKKIFESWWATHDIIGRITLVTVVGCFVFTTCKLLCMQFGLMRSPSKWHSSKPEMKTNTLSWTTECSPHYKTGPACINSRNGIVGRLGELLVMFKKQLKHPPDAGTIENPWPADDLSSFAKAAAVAGNALRKRDMPLEEAEALVKQWQAIKAEVLGPNHQIHILPEWQSLADSAKSRSCYWRFVLLRLSIMRAEIISDGIGREMAEVEAVLEEAAELVDESQPKNPNYYSTYKTQYFLKRQFDGSWRFCGGGIQTPA